jgi:hypothetical protein
LYICGFGLKNPVADHTMQTTYTVESFSNSSTNLPQYVNHVIRPTRETVRNLTVSSSDGSQKNIKLTGGRPDVEMYALQSNAVKEIYRVGGRQYETSLLYAMKQYPGRLLTNPSLSQQSTWLSVRRSSTKAPTPIKLFNEQTPPEYSDRDYTSHILDGSTSAPEHIIKCAWFGCNVLGDALLNANYRLQAFDKRMDIPGQNTPVVWGRTTTSKWKPDEVIPDFLFVKNNDSHDVHDVIAIETKITYTNDTTNTMYGIGKLWHPAKQLFNFYSRNGVSNKTSFQIWLSTCVVPENKDGYIFTLKFNKQQSIVLALRCLVHYMLTNDNMAFTITSPSPTTNPTPKSIRKIQINLALLIARRIGLSETPLYKAASNKFKDLILPRFYKYKVAKEIKPFLDIADSYLKNNSSSDDDDITSSDPDDSITSSVKEMLPLTEAAVQVSPNTGQAQKFNDYVRT